MKSTKMLPREEALKERKWFLVDAQSQILGRVATQVARVLRGKHKASFTPHVDCGDFVVVINAGGIRLSGRKESAKVYYRHSGYPGGIREQSAAAVREKHPERLLRLAVEGMLPKNRLGRRLATKLKVYAGADHPHQAQQPEPLPISRAGARTS